jgi:hypothetical protein
VNAADCRCHRLESLCHAESPGFNLQQLSTENPLHLKATPAHLVIDCLTVAPAPVGLAFLGAPLQCREGPQASFVDLALVLQRQLMRGWRTGSSGRSEPCSVAGLTCTLCSPNCSVERLVESSRGRWSLRD